MGNLGSNTELKFLPSGTAVCNFSVAVSEKWTDKSSGEKREKTTWFRVAAGGKMGETAHKYLKKGSQVMVIGTVEERAYLGSDGEPKASLELRADNVQFLSKAESRPDNVTDLPTRTPPPKETDEIPF